jgi:anti-sigma factor RsiW
LETDRLNRKCPPDIGELAESYYRGMFSPQEAAALEEHYLGCDRCTAELERAEAYIVAMRSAAMRIVKPEGRVFTAGPST